MSAQNVDVDDEHGRIFGDSFAKHHEECLNDFVCAVLFIVSAITTVFPDIEKE